MTKPTVTGGFHANFTLEDLFKSPAMS